MDTLIPPPSVQLYLQDQIAESQPTGKAIVRSMQIKPTERSSISVSKLFIANAPQSLIQSDSKSLAPTKSQRTFSVQNAGSNDAGSESVSNRTIASKHSDSRKAISKPVKSNNDEKIEATLPQISKITILHHFDADENESFKGLSLEKLAAKFVVKREHERDAGLFITLIKNGGTRACWGSVNSSQRNLVQATVYTTEDALGKDYRYSKIKKSEINQLIPQVTVVKKIIPINSIVTMQPLKQGLMVRAGGKGAVLLPGEASDPHYQLVKTKLKAGIPMSQPCQLYRIEADVYR
jgi:AMMECR1 domain-containing protein